MADLGGSSSNNNSGLSTIIKDLALGSISAIVCKTLLAPLERVNLLMRFPNLYQPPAYSMKKIGYPLPPILTFYCL